MNHSIADWEAETGAKVNVISKKEHADTLNLAGGVQLAIPETLKKGKVTPQQPVAFGFRADNLMPLGHGLASGGDTSQLASANQTVGTFGH